MTTRESVVQMRDVTKRFRQGVINHVVALDRVNLDIQPGRVIGLLGDNGAGKSTLIRHVIGYHIPDEGDCRTFGCDVARLTPTELARIGYVHQNGKLLDWMSVSQFIEYVSVYYQTWNHELVAQFIKDFEISMDSRVGALSPGQLQRLAILIAVAFEPDLLLLDEPAGSLDPLARMNFLQLIMNLVQSKERTILISSHILSDVQKIIDHVIIMKAGRILVGMPFDEFQESYCRLKVQSLQGPLPETLPFSNILECERNDRQALVTLQAPYQEEVMRSQTPGFQVERLSMDLEDLYRLVMTHSGSESEEGRS